MKKSVLITLTILAAGLLGFSAFNKGRSCPLLKSMLGRESTGAASSLTHSFNPGGIPLELNDNNFDREVLKSDIPVVVDFWAAWCGPCKKLDPLIEELAKEYEGRIKFGKVDVDENEKLTSQYFVNLIPHIMIFKDGKKIDDIVGFQNKTYLEEKLSALVN